MAIRIERSGKVELLTPRIVAFLEDALHATPLDDIQSPNDTRIDFSCLNGLLAIEMKTLVDDGSERLANLTTELQDREDWPVFYGSWPAASVIKNLHDQEKIAAQISERIGRSIVNHLKKADDQLAAHLKSFPRKNVVRMVLVINEDREIYDPQTACRTIARLLWRIEGENPRYRNIDCVLFATERHATVMNGQVAFPFIVVTGKPVFDAPWKHSVIDFFIQQWGTWSGRSVYNDPPKPDSFSTIEHIPEQMRRRDLWALNYRRWPYMKPFTDDQIRDCWDEIHILGLVAFHKEAPIQIPIEAIAANSERHTHLMEEVAERGLAVPFFRPTLPRMLAAAHRIGLPIDVQAWIKDTLKTLPDN